MTATMTALAVVSAAGEESHFPPGPGSFWQPLFPIFKLGDHTYYFTRPMALILIAAVVLAVLFWVASRRAAVVPGKGQWMLEGLYNFVRNDIARDMIGGRDFARYVPFLFSLFTFILLNNLFGVIPPFQNPPMARIAFPIALTLIVYFVYHIIGFRKKGFTGYFAALVPAGLPVAVRPVILVLETMTFFITRPLTLALRLFGNMFGGHILLVVFIVGGWELLHADTTMIKFVALPAWALGALLTVFEILVQALQAYVFTLLAASYIADAVAEEH